MTDPDLRSQLIEAVKASRVLREDMTLGELIDLADKVKTAQTEAAARTTIYIGDYFCVINIE